MKEKFSMLRFSGDSSPPSSKDTKSASSSSTSTVAVKETKLPKLTAETVVSWSKSFDCLLADKCMLTLHDQPVVCYPDSVKRYSVGHIVYFFVCKITWKTVDRLRWNFEVLLAYVGLYENKLNNYFLGTPCLRKISPGDTAAGLPSLAQLHMGWRWPGTNDYGGTELWLWIQLGQFLDIFNPAKLMNTAL